MPDGCCQLPVMYTIRPAAQKMTMVRMNVAKSELTFSTPILAKIAVKAAKAADSNAYNGHEATRLFIF
jgi:hypothetical protein